MSTRIGLVSLAFVLVISCRGELPTSPTPASGAAAAATESSSGGRRRSVITYPAVFPPACEAPAPLYFSKHPYRNEFIVILQPAQTNAAVTTATLEARYGFHALDVYQVLPGFNASLTPVTIASLRCDPAVKAIEQNSYLSIP